MMNIFERFKRQRSERRISLLKNGKRTLRSFVTVELEYLLEIHYYRDMEVIPTFIASVHVLATDVHRY